MQGLEMNPHESDLDAVPASAVVAQPELTSLGVPLLKGVLYREDDAAQWAALLQLQARVRDYVAVLALELVVDEAEGYAFVRAQPPAEDSAPKLPRLVRRQPLSFQVSLLLRRRLPSVLLPRNMPSATSCRRLQGYAPVERSTSRTGACRQYKPFRRQEHPIRPSKRLRLRRSRQA